MRPLVERLRIKQTPFLGGWLLAVTLAALPGWATTTTPISINFNGTGSSADLSSTTLSYQDTASGNVTPFGAATFNTSGTITVSSATTGTVNGSLTLTFSTGDSIQAAYSNVNLVANGQSIDANSTATITGGTGQFNKIGRAH